MIKVGVTGGIGSGKSTVCQFFEYLGISVYYSDSRARLLMENSDELRSFLVDAFSSECYTLDGKLNKDYLSKEVFYDKKKLQLLNSIVHPLVLKDFLKWAEVQKSRYVIIESAILFDIGWQVYVDKTISVFAGVETRINRIKKRDGSSREDIECRISNQMTDNQRIVLSDYIVYCDDKESIINQILEIDKIIINR